MYVTLNDLKGHAIQATDGSIGSVDEFLFDDEMWTVRYLVVKTGGWLTGRLVLISPTAITAIDGAGKTLSVSLTLAQVKESPDISTDEPISRQAEAEYLRYYSYPLYWRTPAMFGMLLPVAPMDVAFPDVEAIDKAYGNDTAADDASQKESHLRSTREVTGYQLMAQEGEVGRVSDFIFEMTDWSMRYLVVDTGKWRSGKTILVPPRYISAISLLEKSVTVDMSLALMTDVPIYDSSTILNRDYETRLDNHYKRSLNLITAKEQLLKSLIDISNGKKIGSINDIIFDEQVTKVTGVVLVAEQVLRRTYVGIDRASVNVIGQQVWLVAENSSAVPIEQMANAETSQHASEIIGRSIQTEGGTKLGTIGNIIMDTNGDVLGFELKNILVQGPLSERKTIAREAITSVGNKDNPMTTVLAQAEVLSPGSTSQTATPEPATPEA